MRNRSISGTDEGRVRVKGKELISILIRPFQRMLGTTIGDLASTIRVSRDEA